MEGFKPPDARGDGFKVLGVGSFTRAPWVLALAIDVEGNNGFGDLGFRVLGFRV